MRNKITILEASGKVKAVYEFENRKVERVFTEREAEALMVALEQHFEKKTIATILEASKRKYFETIYSASGSL